MKIPRELLGSEIFDDERFVLGILVDGDEVDHYESITTLKSKTIEFDFQKGASEIEIWGIVFP